MSDSGKDIAYAILGFCFGIGSFFWGFTRLRRKRLIENIPTSTVRGLAMGLVELNGKTEKTNTLRSPITNTECVLFKYLVEEYRRSGKSGSWVTIASGNSFFCPFWLNDGTGKIMVYPKGAELILPVGYTFETGMRMGRVPVPLLEFMNKNGIHYGNWLFSRPLRFTEWFICPGDSVYVLGSAKKTEVNGAGYKDLLMQRIRELKKSPQKMQEIDLDKDGAVSIQEWDLAVAGIEKKLLEEELSNMETGDLADVIIGEAESEAAFIISDYSEKELTRKLSDQCLLGIYGGALLSLATLAYLLYRLWFSKL